MRIIAKKTLREFWETHPDCTHQLKSWYQEMKGGRFSSPAEILIKYHSASFLIDNRVVFNVKGNNYRLIVRINYEYQIIWIRFIGTHSSYNRIDATTI